MMDEVRFKFSDEMIHYAMRQVTGCKDSRGLQKAYSSLSQSEFVMYSEKMKKVPANVLELGCGLGRASVYLHWWLGMFSPETHYWMADGNANADKLKYGWDPKEWYNSLQKTAEFAEMNGMVEEDFTVINLENFDLLSLSDVDLVISFLAVGFHFPIEQYLACRSNSPI